MRKDLKKPRFSVIIATLNSERTLERSLKSIELQTYRNIECIFVDGGSSDSTLDIIDRFKFCDKKVIHLKVKGIARAWNAGLKMASGDLITMLNSDDFYTGDIFSDINNTFHGCCSNECVIGFGDTNIIDSDNNHLYTIHGKHPSRIRLLNGFPFMHPSVFFTANTIERIGMFDADKQVAMDTDWLLRAFHSKVKFFKIPSQVSMETGGISDLKKYTGMGEYLDSLVSVGYSNFEIVLFFLFRVFGTIRRMFTKTKS